ncbi:MAG: hypothetical protein WAW13_03775 [Minisyncoccia bacterium]
MAYLLKNLFIALLITLVLGAGYYFIFGNTSTNESSFDVSTSGTAKQQIEKILADTKRVNEYDLSSNIFIDERFTSLVDSRIDLGSAKNGRSNPFAPTN